MIAMEAKLQKFRACFNDLVINKFPFNNKYFTVKDPMPGADPNLPG